MFLAQRSVQPCGGPMKYRTSNRLSCTRCFGRRSSAQDLASFEKRITVKKLDNGLTVVICERPEAPVFSFFTLVDAGSAQDPMGRPAWPTCSSTWRSRAPTRSAPRITPPKKLRWRKWRDAYAAYIAERDKRVGRDRAEAEATAKRPGRTPSPTPTNTSSPTSSARLSNSNGGEDLNAFTSYDETDITTLCPKTGWSSGPISNRSASCIR